MRVVSARSLCVGFVVVVVACASPASSPKTPVAARAEGYGRVTEDTTDDPSIARAEQEYVDLLVSISPEHATELGIHTHDTDLDDRTLAGFERNLAREEAMLRDVTQRFAHPRASRAARTDLALLTHSLAVDIRKGRDERPLERQPDVYASPMNALFLMMARDYAPAKDRAQNALARLEKIPAMLSVAKSNLKRPPRIWTQVGMERASAAKAFFDEQRAPLSDALPDQKARIDDALRAATNAYVDYRAFLERDVLPRSDGEFAAGRSLFAFLLEQGYFLKDDPDALYQMAEKVFATTTAQMTALAKKIDPAAKDWPEVTARLKDAHPTAPGLLAGYRQEVLRARAFLVAHDVVPLPPDDVLEVIDTPVFQRTTIQAAYDEPPPFDKVTKGFFFVTPVDASLPPAQQTEMLRESDWGDIVDTAVHETYPGHHLQLSFARMHPSIIRKATATAILEEGWALYSEELMAELGYYTDRERMMQLEWTLVRAARVLLDIGLHTRGMKFDEAVAVLTDKVHLERELAVSEVKRYTLSPTQPMSYLIGREMLFRMRARYQEREKDRFTLRRFHSEVLSRGSIPPSLMEEEIFEP